MNIVIADKFIALRKSHNLSQEELAVKLGVSRQAVSKWERAESSPDTDNLICLSKLYGISLDALLSEEANDMEPKNGNGPDPRGTNPKLVSEYEVLDESVIAEKPEISNTKFLAWMAGCYPAVITVVYLWMGFTLGFWHPGWMLYLTIPIFYSYYHVYIKNK